MFFIGFSCSFEMDFVAINTPPLFIGVFDTVGALGIPAPFLGTLGTSRYLFHDTEPSRIINHARHAVAIDEMRQDFEPTLWSPKAGIDLKQVWLAGVHTDIGGGYPDHALGDIPGEWMAREAQACGLGLEPHFLLRLNPDYAGRQHNEYKGFYKAWGASMCGRLSRWCMKAYGGGGRMIRCRTRAPGWGSWLGVWGGVV